MDDTRDNIHVKGGPPECPLCRKQMSAVNTKVGVFYICVREFCNISIHKDDPVCGKWRDKEDRICMPCPLCKKPMRTFFRSDGLIIMQCRDKSHNLYQIAKGDPRYLDPNMGGR